MNDYDKAMLRRLQRRIQDHMLNYLSAHNMTKAQLARSTNVSVHIISEAANGTLNPNMSSMILIARAIEMSPSDMIADPTRWIDTVDIDSDIKRDYIDRLA